MQTQLKIEGWPAMVTLDGACRYLSLSPAQFSGLVERWDVPPVEIETAGEALVWRLSDLDRLIKRLPSAPIPFAKTQSVPTVRLDRSTLECLAQAVASELRSRVPLPGQAVRQFVSIKEAGHQLSLGRSTLYRMIQDGALEVRRVGRRTLIAQASIEALLNPESERPLG